VKIILLLNNDIHSALALKLLEDDLRSYEVKIILSQQVGNISVLPFELLEMKKREQFEIENNFSYKTSFCRNINSEESLHELGSFAPDLIISIRFGQILKSPLIKIPQFGVLNLHSGILPNYRGVMASFWAILNGAEELGTTLHYIEDNTIDTGAIIGLSKSKINYESSLIFNINNIYYEGCKLISDCLNKISKGKEIPTLQQNNLGDGEYFSYPKDVDVKKFLKIMPLF
jgi:methionyl-tRNA formyltransferase